MTILSPPLPALHLTIEDYARTTVRDVFRKMIGLDPIPVNPDPIPLDGTGVIVGYVGFVGAATGMVYLHANLSLARLATENLLGLSPGDIEDAFINDAFGELTNMVVGGLKTKLCDAGWTCALTIPSVVRGDDFSVECLASLSRSYLRFQVGAHPLGIEITVKKPSP